MIQPNAAGGQRIREFFSAEAEALLATYQNIERLLPAHNRAGAVHSGEEGRHIESLVRAFLNRHLPQSLRAFSGFILRPSTKAGAAIERRREGPDEHSRQIDVIVYDVDRFPVFERYEEFAIVPPEGVVGVISVKKRLYLEQVGSELAALSEAVALCRHRNSGDEWVRGPNATLVAFSTREPTDPTKEMKHVFEKISSNSDPVPPPFDQLISQVVVLDTWSIFKSRPYFIESHVMLACSLRNTWDFSTGKTKLTWGCSSSSPES